ncbi:Neuropeptide receptor A5, partial [Operophtera brumata]
MPNLVNILILGIVLLSNNASTMNNENKDIVDKVKKVQRINNQTYTEFFEIDKNNEIKLVLVQESTYISNTSKQNMNITKELCIGAEEYCNMTKEDYTQMLNNYIYPQTYEWVLIATHTLVFIMGLAGNALVCVAVYRNHTMRTVTNYFIVNLAVADFMVILMCLPPTVLWDVTETWFFGDAISAPVSKKSGQDARCSGDNVRCMLLPSTSPLHAQ